MIRKGLGYACMVALLIIGIIPACSESTPAGQFTADIVEAEKGVVSSGKLMVRDSYYRMDVEESGNPLYVIVDQLSCKTRIVIPANKQFMEIGCQDMMSLSNDAFQSLVYTANFAEETAAGTETVQGYECDVFKYSADGKDIVTKWVARKLNFPIKIVNHLVEGKYLELTNIQEVSVESESFGIPTGFTRFDPNAAQPVELPEWALDISSAPLVKVPIDQSLSAGQMIRVKTEPGKSLWLKATGPDDSKPVARAMPFKNGVPLRDVNAHTNFAQKGTICARINESAVESDEIVIRVFEGDVKLTGKHFDMFEKEVAAGEEYRVNVNASLNIEDLRWVNIGEGEAVGSWNYYKDGQPIDESQSGPIKYRTIAMSGKGDVKKSSMRVLGDEIVFKVERGKVLIRLGQWDPFKY